MGTFASCIILAISPRFHPSYPLSSTTTCFGLDVLSQYPEVGHAVASVESHAPEARRAMRIYVPQTVSTSASRH